MDGDASLRGGGCDEIDVGLERSRDGILQCADGLLTAGGVGEDGKVSLEELVGLGGRDGDRYPVSSGARGCKLDTIVGQPLGHSGGGFCRGTGKGLNLLIDSVP